MAVVALAVLGLGAYGYYDTNVRPEQQAVLRIGDRKLDMGSIERRLAYSIHAAAPGDVILTNPQAAVRQVIQNVVEEEIIRQGAPAINITVSEEEIDNEIRRTLRIPETSDTNAFAEAYRDEVRNSGLHPNEYREMVAAELLVNKVRELFRSQIPSSAEQIHLRTIAVAEEEEAQVVLSRLGAGEDFAALAAELSTDTSTQSGGGDMGWAARASLPADVESVVFTLEVGQLSDPVPLDGSFHIYQVLEKAADREVTPEQRQQIEEESYSRWQLTVVQQLQVVTYLDTDQQTRLFQKAVEEGSGASGQ